MGIAPIEDQITRYAFPSKLSTYTCANAKVLAICGEDTSVAKWVRKNKVGLVVKPNVENITDIFFKIENNTIDNNLINLDRKNLKKNFSMEKFVNKLKDVILF